MTGLLENKEQTDTLKSNQPLNGRQKLYFGLCCWGVHSWGLAKNFKEIGYDQKHKDAWNAIYTGLAIYTVGILLFILWLL